MRPVELAVRPGHVSVREVGAAERPQSPLEPERDAELERRIAHPLGDPAIPGHRLRGLPQADLLFEREPAVLVAQLALLRGQTGLREHLLDGLCALPALDIGQDQT